VLPNTHTLKQLAAHNSGLQQKHIIISSLKKKLPLTAAYQTTALNAV